MNDKKIPEPVETLILIVSIFTVIIVLTLFASFGTMLVTGNESVLEKMTRLFLLVGGLIFLVIPVTYAKIRKYPLRSIFRLNPVSGEVILISLLIGLSLAVVGDGLDRLIQIIIPIPDWVVESMNRLTATSFSEWVIIILAAVVIASVSEEMLFRGMLQISLENKGDINRAVILSSLTWTLIHMNPYWAVQIFVMGIILGYLAWRTDSIVPSLIAHALNNMVALLFNNLKLDTGIDWYLYGDQVSPAVMIVAVALLVWSIRRLSSLYQNESYQES